MYRSGRVLYGQPLIWGAVMEGRSVYGVLRPLSSAFRLTAAGLPSGCYQTEAGTTDIWLVDMSRRINAPLTHHPTWDLHPVWSPDGTQIAFASQKEGPAKLFKMLIGGSGSEERLLDSTTNNRPTDWSPDGRFIVYRIDDPARIRTCGRSLSSATASRFPSRAPSSAKHKGASRPMEPGLPIAQTIPDSLRSTSRRFLPPGSDGGYRERRLGSQMAA